MAKSKHDQTAERLAKKESTEYNRGQGADVQGGRRAIEVETETTARDGLRQLQGYRKAGLHRRRGREGNPSSTRGDQRNDRRGDERQGDNRQAVLSQEEALEGGSPNLSRWSLFSWATFGPREHEERPKRARNVAKRRKVSNRPFQLVA